MKTRNINPWVVVGLLWFVGLLNYLDRQMLATMRPAMEMDIASLQSAENFGILMSVFLWIYGIMSPVSGVIADRLNRKWLIVISLFIWSAVTYGMGFADTFEELKWLRAVMGFSEAIYIPAALSLIADYHGSKTRSLAVGIHMTGLYVGQALGGFGATIAQAYTWHSTFHLFGIVGIVYALILAFFLKEKRTVAVQEPTTGNGGFKPLGGIAWLLGNLSFWVVLLYFAIPSLPGWATKNWLPTLFSESLSLDMSVAGPIATITIALSSFIGVILGGIVSDRWVQRNIKARVYTSAAGVLLTVPAVIILGYGHTSFALIAAGVLFGIGFGVFDANNMPILCQFVPSRFRATGYGLMNMTGVFFGAFITSFLGKSSDAGHLGRDFALMAGVVLFVVVLQLLVLKPRHQELP
ncbi:MFS transporter [Niabella beijingensis]|uniref:MFS transporter n=1 Tax=Niabella beijingensis TaxID=2872700 RepID=UPI001CBDD08B|nr:MFS transporter [Niabella beijingensis]MBZ4192455.1 MFS transporter [Niabella beijingensis]